MVLGHILKNEGHCGSDFCFLSSYIYCTCSKYLNIGRVRTCGLDKSSNNDRKMQINIEIRDFFQSQKVRVCDILSPSLPKVCVCVWGICPPPNDAHVNKQLRYLTLAEA